MTAGPVLRDIHVPAEPAWWPPAPGWWVLAALAALAIVWLLRRQAQARRVRRAQRALRTELERLRAEAPAGAAQVAAMSMLLRRAAKRYAPDALMLRDEAWLQFLDGDDPARPFSAGPGRLLIDGPYRRHVDADEASALDAVVRRRLDDFVAPPKTRRSKVAAHAVASDGAPA